MGFFKFWPDQGPFLVVEFWLISHMNNRKLPNFKDLIHAYKATICSSLKQVHWFSSFFQSECHELVSQIWKTFLLGPSPIGAGKLKRFCSCSLHLDQHLAVTPSSCLATWRTDPKLSLRRAYRAKKFAAKSSRIAVTGAELNVPIACLVIISIAASLMHLLLLQFQQHFNLT